MPSDNQSGNVLDIIRNSDSPQTNNATINTTNTTYIPLPSTTLQQQQQQQLVPSPIPIPMPNSSSSSAKGNVNAINTSKPTVINKSAETIKKRTVSSNTNAPKEIKFKSGETRQVPSGRFHSSF